MSKDVLELLYETTQQALKDDHSIDEIVSRVESAINSYRLEIYGDCLDSICINWSKPNDG